MKYELLNHHETENAKKEARLAAKVKLQEELVKQQAEFLERQRIQKEDMKEYEAIKQKQVDDETRAIEEAKKDKHAKV
jgi:hypothetical protein